jgi:hypothetical protein
MDVKCIPWGKALKRPFEFLQQAYWTKQRQTKRCIKYVPAKGR